MVCFSISIWNMSYKELSSPDGFNFPGKFLKLFCKVRIMTVIPCYVPDYTDRRALWMWL